MRPSTGQGGVTGLASRRRRHGGGGAHRRCVDRAVRCGEGTRAAGLDIVPKRVPELLPVGTDGAAMFPHVIGPGSSMPSRRTIRRSRRGSAAGNESCSTTASYTVGLAITTQRTDSPSRCGSSHRRASPTSTAGFSPESSDRRRSEHPGVAGGSTGLHGRDPSGITWRKLPLTHGRPTLRVPDSPVETARGSLP